jgi:hypothetical protein
MIMKKPIIIAHSACQGFGGRACPGARDVGVVIYPTSFRLPSMLSAMLSGLQWPT